VTVTSVVLGTAEEPWLVRVLSVYGSRDGSVTPQRIAATRGLLPADARYVEIEGANHNQFAAYRFQPGDGRATISREEQRRRVVAATVAFLREL
jgi:hypothetical protein